MRTSIATAVVLAWAGLTGTAQTMAGPGRPMPAVSVTRPDGTAVTNIRPDTGEHWVLVHVRPDCRPCERLVAALPGWQAASMASRVVLVVEADASAGATWTAGSGWPKLGGPWYSDPVGSVRRGLSFGSALTVVGVRGLDAAWILDGVLNDPAALRQAVESWLIRG
jgi:hypothetical protein